MWFDVASENNFASSHIYRQIKSDSLKGISVSCTRQQTALVKADHCPSLGKEIINHGQVTFYDFPAREKKKGSLSPLTSW